MSKEFGAKLVYGDNDKYIKTKIKMCGDNVNRNFHIKKIPKENTACKKYYSQTLLEECKYEIKKNKMENLINADLDSSSSDNETDNNSDNDTDNDADNESDNDEPNE